MWSPFTCICKLSFFTDYVPTIQLGEKPLIDVILFSNLLHVLHINFTTFPSSITFSSLQENIFSHFLTIFNVAILSFSFSRALSSLYLF